MENGWQGNPPQRISASGISLLEICAISHRNKDPFPHNKSEKLRSKVILQYLSKSLENTQENPAFSKAILIHHIPANRSMNLNIIRSKKK
jgi:hypothetical protein